MQLRPQFLLILGISALFVSHAADAGQICACKRITNGKINRVTAVPPGPAPTCTGSKVSVCWNDEDSPEPVRSAVVTFSRNAALGSGSQAITGVGFQPTAVLISCAEQSADGALAGSLGFASESGTTGSLSISGGDGTMGSSGDGVYVGASVSVNPTGDTGSHNATLASLDADGFTLDWVIDNSPAFDIECRAFALR